MQFIITDLEILQRLSNDEQVVLRKKIVIDPQVIDVIGLDVNIGTVESGIVVKIKIDGEVAIDGKTYIVKFVIVEVVVGVGIPTEVLI